MSHLVPFIPETAPFTLEQRAWLNGFLAGLYSRAPSAGPGAVIPAPAPARLKPLTILFGSQTGTAEGLAKRAAKAAGKRGFAPMVLDLGQIDLARLASEQNVLLITSTYGDGEPPDNAKALHTALAAAGRAPAQPPALARLRYSVCGLGDTNYVHFCRCAQEFDTYLEQGGATRIAARADCDLDLEEKFAAWLEAALTAFGSDTGREPSSPPSSAAVAPPEVAVVVAGSSRAHPFAAPLLTSRKLNAPGSAKEVFHVELDLAGAGFNYEAGDALGVFPQNCPALVGDILAVLGCDGEEAVPAPDGTTTSLRHALSEHYDLGRPSPELLARYAPGAVPEGGIAVARHHVVDVILARADLRLTPVEFVRLLKKIQPRLYSISSSPRAHAGQVHLTVGAVRYDLHGRPRKGVCSTFLADQAVAGESRVRVFVHSNKAFRPPANPATPVIMVGPGTGIAPFRAFLHERQATGATGRNWLFFGDQRADTDFLYRDELAALQGAGVLTRLDTAFSRDQADKVYVQHRMLESAAELYSWLEAGAHFYVCGDASRMAKDVDVALRTLVQRAGGKTAAQAADYVQALTATKRYARDVY